MHPYPTESAYIEPKSGGVQAPACDALAGGVDGERAADAAGQRRPRFDRRRIGPGRCCSPRLIQGPTLVHFSAQRKRFVWDRVCI